MPGEKNQTEEKKEAMPLMVAPDVAGIEVGKWLDYKRIVPTKRATCGNYINELIQAVMYGILVIQKDFTIVHNLNFPVLKVDADEILFDKLTYAARLSAAKMSESLQGVDTTNEVENSIAVGYALTGKATALIGRLDTSDLRVLSAIGVFF